MVLDINITCKYGCGIGGSQTPKPPLWGLYMKRKMIRKKKQTELICDSSYYLHNLHNLYKIIYLYVYLVIFNAITWRYYIFSTCK